MPEIRPFRGLRFNRQKVSSIERVVAPPYDVIDPPLEKVLRERHDHNIVRLTLGKTPPGGRPEEDYRRAAHSLARWREAEVLIQEARPALYVVEQTFSLGEQAFVRWGFIAALLLEEFGKGQIHAHERTTQAARSDRLKLMSACRASLSPVLAIYADPDGLVDRRVGGLRESAPLYSFRDTTGIAYRLWAVSDAAVIDRLAGLMRGLPLFIADGHHRYESALQYRAACRSPAAPPGSAPEDLIPAFCVSLANAGLKSLATHRRVTGPEGLDEAALRRALGEHFDLQQTPVGTPDMLEADFDRAQQGTPCVGCYLRGGNLFLARATHPQALRSRFPQSALSWWQLPVSLLHYVILPDLLGIEPGSPDEAQRVDYRREASEVCRGVESGLFAAGFLLPATDPKTITVVAGEGERLPPKSTYFCPKLSSGLVLYAHTE